MLFYDQYMTHYTAIQLFVVDDMVHYRCTAEGTAHVPPLTSVFHFCILPPPSVSVWNMSVNWRNPSLQVTVHIRCFIVFHCYTGSRKIFLGCNLWHEV